MIRSGNPWRRCALLFAPCVACPYLSPRNVCRCRGDTRARAARHYLTNQRNSWPPRPGLIPSSTLRLCPPAWPVGRPALYKPQVGRQRCGDYRRIAHPASFSPRLLSAPADSTRPFPMCKMRRALRPSGHASLTYGQLPGPAGQAGVRRE